jgi:hypothetical protein
MSLRKDFIAATGQTLMRGRWQGPPTSSGGGTRFGNDEQADACHRKMPASIGRLRKPIGDRSPIIHRAFARVR